MLNEEQQKVPVEGLVCRDVVVLLQCINRLVKSGVLRDNELSVVGRTRENLVASMENAIGINFDEMRAMQEAEIRRQQQEQQEQAEPATETETATGTQG